MRVIAQALGKIHNLIRYMPKKYQIGQFKATFTTEFPDLLGNRLRKSALLPKTEEMALSPFPSNER